MKSAAPGKIIICGEHSVVFGKPALVMAVDLFSITRIKQLNERTIAIHLKDFNLNTTVQYHQVFETRNTLNQLYNKYLDGSIEFEQITSGPDSLLLFLIAEFFEKYNIEFKVGIELAVSSQLPLGGGMGSSASVIMSTLFALAAFYNIEIVMDELYQLGLNCENLVHGRSSGVDPFIALYGGLKRFQNNQAMSLTTPADPLFIVYTGKPESGTGECVNHVKKRFGNSGIWSEFAAVTENIQQAFKKNDANALLENIKINHQLLVRIGVVPASIQQYIRRIEEMGGAAKISGAGAVRGENAGAVLITGPVKPDQLPDYGYKVYQVKAEDKGARIL